MKSVYFVRKISIDKKTLDYLAEICYTVFSAQLLRLANEYDHVFYRKGRIDEKQGML